MFSIILVKFNPNIVSNNVIGKWLKVKMQSTRQTAPEIIKGYLIFIKLFKNISSKEANIKLSINRIVCWTITIGIKEKAESELPW